MFCHDFIDRFAYRSFLFGISGNQQVGVQVIIGNKSQNSLLRHYKPTVQIVILQYILVIQNTENGYFLFCCLGSVIVVERQYISNIELPSVNLKGIGIVGNQHIIAGHQFVIVGRAFLDIFPDVFRFFLVHRINVIIVVIFVLLREIKDHAKAL